MTKIETLLEDALANLRERPHGDPATADVRDVAGQACVKLCRGDHDQARTLWRLITDDLGYMPVAAAVALNRAANTDNLVPDIPAPDLDAVPR